MWSFFPCRKQKNLLLQIQTYHSPYCFPNFWKNCPKEVDFSTDCGKRKLLSIFCAQHTVLCSAQSSATPSPLGRCVMRFLTRFEQRKCKRFCMKLEHGGIKQLEYTINSSTRKSKYNRIIVKCSLFIYMYLNKNPLKTDCILTLLVELCLFYTVNLSIRMEHQN